MIDHRRLEAIIHTYQTTEVNVYREYSQHLFLSSFYKKKGSEKVLFRGGTALRFIYKSPRFSEDLDFSAPAVNKREIENMLIDVLLDLKNQNLECEIEEAKPTSGGYLANFFGIVDHKKVTIAIQISLRKKVKEECQTLSVTNEYIPNYIANVLPLEELAGEKVQAALTRSKPRDFFDIYFLLREGLFPKNKMESLSEIKAILKKKDINFQTDLKLFLPLSMKPLVKSFPKPLLNEIERFF